MPLITTPNHIYNRTNKDTHRTCVNRLPKNPIHKNRYPCQSLYKQAHSDARSLYNREREAPTANLHLAHNRRGSRINTD